MMQYVCNTGNQIQVKIYLLLASGPFQVCVGRGLFQGIQWFKDVLLSGAKIFLF